MFTIRVEFSEKASRYAYPVVAHEFTGFTLKEAKGFFRAHLRYDRMLRATTTLLEEGTWFGTMNKITFRTIIRIIKK